MPSARNGARTKARCRTSLVRSLGGGFPTSSPRKRRRTGLRVCRRKGRHVDKRLDIYYDAIEEEQPSRRTEKATWGCVVVNTMLWVGIFLVLLVILASI